MLFLSFGAQQSVNHYVMEACKELKDMVLTYEVEADSKNTSNPVMVWLIGSRIAML